jgi:hypothetical protein
MPGDGDGLSTPDRVDWARNAMADLIDAELEMLLAHRETLDVEAIEQDRAGAAGRALFDPSKEAILARRYEAAAERGVYRALRELERVEAAATAGAADEESLGSFGAGVPGDCPDVDEPGARPLGSVGAAPSMPRKPHAPATERSNERRPSMSPDRCA